MAEHEPMLLKVIACEIAFRELSYAASRSKNLIDFEFLTQGYHDVPAQGRAEIQRRIDAVPAGRYRAIILGYGLCSNILTGLTTAHTPLVIPRAHDCITFFLGSKERYRQAFDSEPGTYYYTSGWLECAKRRGDGAAKWGGAAMPAGSNANLKSTFEQWVQKYGEETALYLMEEMGRWTQAYNSGTLIAFDFLEHLKLDEQVKKICGERGWQFQKKPGNLGLLQRLLDVEWNESEVLVVQPGQKVVASFDEKIIGSAKA
jgi:hypothetical protein